MKNAFTIDLEDWYQGIAIPEKEWGAYEKRIRIGFDKLMNLLTRHKVKATFFILGKVVEEHPDIIKEIISGGHEIGCHTYSHEFLYEMNPQTFTQDIIKCKSAIASLGSAYTGFRAPFFSIDHRSWWALDILQKEGFLYDSSIYPGDSKRTGIVGYRKDIHLLENKMWEAPVSTFKLTKFDVGLGGAYFRILPYPVFKYKFRQINKTRSGIFYIHPWELDPEHPYMAGLPPRIRLPHYYNLKNTEKKIEKLLIDFEFIPLFDIINKPYQTN